MDESMGPCESDCPARILNQLSPFKDESKHKYAADWRKRCRANLEKTALKLRDGMTVKLPEPLTFTDGSKLDTFTVRKNGRKFRFYNGGMPYRITCWNKRGLTEVTASADVE